MKLRDHELDERQIKGRALAVLAISEEPGFYAIDADLRGELAETEQKILAGAVDHEQHLRLVGYRAGLMYALEAPARLVRQAEGSPDGNAGE